MTRSPSTRALLLLALFTLALVVPLAAAQPRPLADLAPAESFLLLGWSPSTAPATSLKRDLEALEWERAEGTLKKLGALNDDPSLRDFLDMADMGFGGYRAGKGTSRFEQCLTKRTPESFTDELVGMETPPWEEALVSVGGSPYNPIPAATAMVRVAPRYEAQFAELQRILVTCSERTGNEVKRLREGEVPLVVIGNASDFPVVVSRVGTLFVAGSNPEAVRGVVRRAGGSSEPSLSTTPFYRQNKSLLERPGRSFALNAAALGDSAESLSANFTDAQTAPLAERLIASLRTLGSYAGTLGFRGNTLTLTTQLRVNPQGGDPELARLLLCKCPAEAPRLASESSYRAISTHVPVREVFDYLDGWTRLAGRASGEPTDLRQLAQTFGLDLDRALLDWLGNESLSVVLEPLGTDLTPYIYGQPQVFALKTKGEAATRAGFTELSRAFKRFLAEQDFEGAEAALFLQSATERQVFGGIDITRTRFGPNFDLGVAFLDDTVLIGMPAAALEPVISTAQGYTRSLTDDEAFRAAQEGVPEVVTVGYSDLSRGLQGLSDLTQLASQPLAFVALAGLSDLSGPNQEAAATPTFAELLYVTDLLPRTLGVLSQHLGTLSSHRWVEENIQHSRMSLELK